VTRQAETSEQATFLRSLDKLLLLYDAVQAHGCSN